MSEIAAAVAAQIPNAPQDAPEAPVKSRIAELIAERFPDKKPKAEEPAVEAAPAEPEAAKVEESVVEPEPVKNRVELALAKAQRELKAHKAELEKLKSGGEGLEKLKASFAKNPLKALEEATGKSVKEIFEAAKRGDYDIRDDLPPEVKEKLSWIEKLQAKEAEREKADAEAKAQAERAEHVAKATPRVKAMIEQEASKYPFLAAVEQSAEAVIDEIYALSDAGEAVDVPAVMAKVDKDARSIASFWLRQSGVIVQLVKNDDKLREMLTSALGKPGAAAPAQVTKAPSSVGTLTEVVSRKDPARNVTREISDEWARVRKGS